LTKPKSEKSGEGFNVNESSNHKSKYIYSQQTGSESTKYYLLESFAMMNELLNAPKRAPTGTQALRIPCVTESSRSIE
jgi:hypothetical protein